MDGVESREDERAVGVPREVEPRSTEDPNAPIIVDAPPDSPEFGVVRLEGSKGGELWDLLYDLGFFRFWP